MTQAQYYIGREEARKAFYSSVGSKDKSLFNEKKWGHRSAKAVIDTLTMTTYESPSQAAEFTGLSAESIRSACTKRNPNIRWRYAEDHAALQKMISRGEVKEKKFTHAKRVRHNATGKVFASLNDAAGNFGISAGAINYQIRTNKGIWTVLESVEK